MSNLTLSEEQQLLQRTARAFARTEISPIVQRVQKARAAGENPDPWAFCKEMFQKGWDLGFTRMLIPEVHGGNGSDMIDAAIVLEEFGAADVAIAADLFALNMTVPLIVAGGADETQKQRILPLLSKQATVLSGALSEPNIAGSELFTQNPDPKLGIKTFARRAGENYIIRGQKSAFVTNCGIADYYFVLARTSLELPLWESISIFFVPATTRGILPGTRTRMSGWHTGHHAELTLDDVEVPATNLIGGEGSGVRIMSMLPQMAVGLAAAFVGLARASYEYALNYANQRISMGVPIIRHQAVALKLADMYCDYHTARLTLWDAARGCDADLMGAATLLAPLAKTCAVDAAIRNAERALQILGAYGVTEEYPTAGWLADAWVGYACDFTRDMLRLGMLSFLPTSA